MNQENGNSEIDLSTKIYDFLSSKATLKLAFIWCIIFIVSFLLHFPIKKIFENSIRSALSQIRECPINYSELNISFILPYVELKEISIGGKCFQQPTQNLLLDYVNIRPAFPGILPLGPKFYLTAKTKNSEIHAYALISFGSQKITITQSKIHTALINNLIGLGPILSGSFTIDGSLNIKSNKPDQGEFSLQSQNLSLQQANIQGIALPQMSIGTLDIKAHLKDETLITLERGDLGSDGADIIARFKGTTNLDTKRPLSSRVNVEGSFFLGKKLNQAVPLINLFLQNKSSDENGFYRFKISGTIENPLPQIL